MARYVQQLSACQQFETSDMEFLDSSISVEYSTLLYLYYIQKNQLLKVWYIGR